jgi:hypothetical protein
MFVTWFSTHIVCNGFWAIHRLQCTIMIIILSISVHSLNAPCPNIDDFFNSPPPINCILVSRHYQCLISIPLAGWRQSSARTSSCSSISKATTLLSPAHLWASCAAQSSAEVCRSLFCSFYAYSCWWTWRIYSWYLDDMQCFRKLPCRWLFIRGLDDVSRFPLWQVEKSRDMSPCFVE